jgi:DNA-binding protein H-NS
LPFFVKLIQVRYRTLINRIESSAIDVLFAPSLTPAFLEYPMNTLQQLLEQKAAIEQKIAAAREQAIHDAVARARAIIDEFGLTAEDLFGGKRTRKSSNAGTKVAAKYRDPATGQTWTGRGRTPKWMEGKDRNAYLIK